METILNFAGDTAVHASAGTGKTWLLVEKFLHELSRETEGRLPGIENILAITFTEKAADEMRRRIARRIFNETASLAAAPMDAAAARRSRHLTASRRRMARAYISTIHSFCARVLRENPVEAGIDPHFEIMDERRAQALLEGALRQFLTLKIRQRDAAVMDLAYRYGFAGTGNSDNSLSAMLTNLLPLARASGMAHGALLAPYAGFMPGHRAAINERLAGLRRGLSAAAIHAVKPDAKEMLARAGIMIRDMEAALDADPEEAVRLAEAARNGINAGKIRKASAELKRIKETLEDIGNDVAGALSHRQAETLVTLLEEFRRHYQTGVKNRGRLDFGDLEEMTIALFKHNPDIRAAYQQNFRKVLVDEYQDVNHIQKELIYLLAAPGEGKLFVVGDPKQAIYGFRGGDVDVFMETKKEITERGGGLFFLKTNRRSVKELVDFTNGALLKSAPALFTADDECGAERPISGGPAVECFFTGGDVSAGESRYLEARRIAARIREMSLEGTARLRDIAILFRKFTALPLYEAVFRAHGIPFAVHKGTGFFQSQEVKDIVSLLAFIEDPGDLVSWAAALRSPYAGCSDETLLALRRGPDMKPAPPDRADADAIANGGEREKYRHFEKWTAHLRRAKDRMAVSEIIETALRESGIIGILGAQPNGMQQVANVQKTIEIARAADGGGTAALKNFVREMLGMIDGGETEPQAAVAEPDTDADPDMDVVKIMTIHQSKGLEFKVVIVPDITAAAGGWPAPAAFHLRAGLGLKYIDKTLLTTHKGAVYQNVKTLIDAKERDDAERLFYVACTRAREKLILSGSLKKTGGERAAMLLEAAERLPHIVTRITGADAPPAAAARQSAWDILKTHTPAAAPETAEAMRGDSGGLARFSVGQISLFRKCRQEYLLRHIHRLQPPPGPARERRSPAAEAGSAVHALLETLDFTAPEKEFRHTAGQGAALHLAGLDKQTQKEAKSAVANLYGRGIFAKLRREGLQSFGREIPFTLGYARGNRRYLLAGIMDALAFTRAGNVYVIDYKFAEKPARAKLDEAMPQPRLYALAAARALPAAGAINCALVYLRGKDPATEEWTVTPDELERIGTSLTADSEKILAFEESMSLMPELPVVPPASCPDRLCRFHPFCFPLGD